MTLGWSILQERTDYYIGLSRYGADEIHVIKVPFNNFHVGVLAVKGGRDVAQENRDLVVRMLLHQGI